MEQELYIKVQALVHRILRSRESGWVIKQQEKWPIALRAAPGEPRWHDPLPVCTPQRVWDPQSTLVTTVILAGMD